MRRADRLFQIVQHLRGGRSMTAATLAERLEVSERTIYRDIADLKACGVPIDGEAGVGYLMRDGFDLPPLMFSRDEIAALVAGARIVRAWGGVEMARAAEEALVKITAVLPAGGKRQAEQVAIDAWPGALSEVDRRRLDQVESAIEHRLKLELAYSDADQRATQRTVRPLGLWFWGQVWLLVAWCELRSEFRMFRIDRMRRAELGAAFKPERGRTLADYYHMIEAEGCVAPGQMAPRL
ncbi:MAG: YafY family transcriptional regulator [Neomegalonema sp.]|nr:YafY family transcriptional regulator [Neomegalonema sp.]